MLFAPLVLSALGLFVTAHHIPLAGRSSHNHVVRNDNSSISNIGKRSYSSKVTYFGIHDSDRNLFCGVYYEHDYQMLAALNLGSMLHTAHTDPNCFRWITLSYKGKTVDVQVLDACAEGECLSNPYHVDISPGAFDVLAPRSEGILENVEWWFRGEGPEAAKTTPETPQWTPTSTWTPEPETSTWTPEPETSTWTPPPETSQHTEESSSITSTSAIASSTTSSFSPSSLASGLPRNLTVSALNTTTTAGVNSTINDTRVFDNATASANVTVAIPNVTAAATPDHIVSTDSNIDGNLAHINHLVATFGRIILAGVSM